VSLKVLFEDDWLLAVDKPAGLLVIPAPGGQARTLTGVLNEDAVARGVSWRLHPCHRLDKETSGVILYAKGKSIQQKMMQLFKERKIKKTYRAFVHGKLPRPAGEIRMPLEGKAALTRYRVLEQRKDFSIVEVIPETGRKNQIRLHFKALGHPLVGESKFAFRRDFTLRARRLCLHAQSIAFAHPVTSRPVSLEAGLPPDMRRFLELHP